MSQTSRSAVSFLAATIVVFGGIYFIDRYADWKPFGTQKPMQEIKGSVGTVSPIDSRQPGATVPLDDASPSNYESASKGNRGAVFRCQMNGKTIYSDAPCDGYKSIEVSTQDSSGVTIVDPKEVEKFRAQALAPKPIVETRPTSGPPSKVSPVRSQCDYWEKYIRSLDISALQPLPGFEQDRIKRQRKEARQLMFDLDCMHA